MAVISINYDESDVKTYVGVELSYDITNKFVCASGDFIKDWYHIIKFLVTSQLEEPVIYSSSVDHFFMDGAPYDSFYLKVQNDVGSLTTDQTGIEIFVEKGTNPTWEELKKYCETV